MNLRKTAASGILKIGAARIIQQPISLLITAILARLLSPKDFGLIGIVTIFTAFIQIFSYLGLGSAIIQKKNITHRQLSTIFWIGMIFGAVSALLLAAASYPISLLYKEPQLAKLIGVLSVTFCISPLYQINRRLLEKHFRFSAIAIREIVSAVLSGAVGIMAALLRWGVWSLVVQSLSYSLICLITYKLAYKWSPQFILDFRACRELIQFGLHMVGAYFASYLERNIDFFLISRLYGSVTLGFYSLAARIMYYPVRQVSNIFVEVLYPAFSKVQDNIGSVQRGFLDSVKYISIITFPLMTLAWLLADEAVAFFFGTRWGLTSSILKILAPAGAVYSIWQVSWALFPALGKADLRMRLGFLQSILLILGIWLGRRWGFPGVIYGISFSAVIIWMISQSYINKLLNLPVSSIVQSLKPSVLGCAIMVLSDRLISLFRLSFLDGEPFQLLFSFAVCALAYALTFLVFFRKDIKSILGLVFRFSEEQAAQP